MYKCFVCGGNEFREEYVLWDELIEQWKLSPEEVAYINRQQGRYCTECLANLRSIALAKAILESYHYNGTFKEFVRSPQALKLKVLEINEAAKLHEFLKEMPNHRIAKYPECDMQNMNYDSESWDMVIHSDTLEHVPDPIKAIRECKRILRYDGRLFFTIPIIVDRLSMSRCGMPKSYHGTDLTKDSDFAVCTEFGADYWKYIVQAGFSSLRLCVLDYPAAMAIEAVKSDVYSLHVNVGDGFREKFLRIFRKG